MERHRRRRYSRGQKSRHVEMALRSGNLSEYAKKHRIGYSNLLRWKRSLEGTSKKASGKGMKHLVLVSTREGSKTYLYVTQDEATKKIQSLIQRDKIKPSDISYFEKAPYSLTITI